MCIKLRLSTSLINENENVDADDETLRPFHFEVVQNFVSDLKKNVARALKRRKNKKRCC